MRIQVGDVVELVDNQSMGAPVGSLARVKCITVSNLDVVWLQENHNQQNGGYRKGRFRLVENKPATMDDTREYLEAIASWQ